MRTALFPMLAVTVLAAAPAFAQAPASLDDCLKQAGTLAKSAQDKKLAPAALEGVEKLLTKLEDQCAAKKFNEAGATVGEIKAAIEAK